MIMSNIKLLYTLTVMIAVVLGSLAVEAAATTVVCSSPYQEGKRYAVGDWVSAPLSAISVAAANGNGDNLISCSPPGVDGCPSSGFIIVDHAAASNQRYNYRCNSLESLCSDEKYAPGAMLSGMAWSMMGVDPCSDDQSNTQLNKHLQMNYGLDHNGSAPRPRSSSLLTRRMQSKSSKTCAPSSAPTGPTAMPTTSSVPTTASPSSSPSSSPTAVPSTLPPTISFQPTRSKSGKPSRPPVSKEPTTFSPTKARSIRCLNTRSAKFSKETDYGTEPKAISILKTNITEIIQTTNITEVVPMTNGTEIVQATNETETMLITNGTTIMTMANGTEITQTANDTEILRHRPHLVPSDGQVQ